MPDTAPHARPEPYKRTPEFDQDSIPAGLLRRHATASGIWGRICVSQGRLLLRFTDNGKRQVLDPHQSGIVAPEQIHEVEALGPVRFHIEFYRTDPTPLLADQQGDSATRRGTMRVSLVDRQPHPELDEDKIVEVVDTFYRAVRADDVLAPVFNAIIAEEQWPHHLGRMYDFWSSLLLGTRRYDGRPLPKHLAIPGLGDQHFARWLGLFRQTVEAVCSPEVALVFIEYAERIAHSFRLGLAMHRGENTTIVERLRAGERD